MHYWPKYPVFSGSYNVPKGISPPKNCCTLIKNQLIPLLVWGNVWWINCTFWRTNLLILLGFSWYVYLVVNVCLYLNHPDCLWSFCWEKSANLSGLIVPTCSTLAPRQTLKPSLSRPNCTGLADLEVVFSIFYDLTMHYCPPKIKTIASLRLKLELWKGLERFWRTRSKKSRDWQRHPVGHLKIQSV